MKGEWVGEGTGGGGGGGRSGAPHVTSRSQSWKSPPHNGSKPAEVVRDMRYIDIYFIKTYGKVSILKCRGI